MMKKKENKKIYSALLLDIVRGHSVLEYSNRFYYFKHFKVVDFLEFDHLQEQDIKKSISSGIKSEKDLVDSSIKVGSWSVAEEESLKSQEWMLKKSITAFGKITDLAQKKVFESQIESQKKKLNKLKTKRAKITSYSAEHLAELKKVKRMTQRSVFLDPNFTEAYDAQEETILATLLFAKVNELGSRETLLRCSYFCGFFDLFAASGGPSTLINQSFLEITDLQKNLIVLTHALLNKIKNTSIPDEIASDPIRIMDYEEKDDAAAKVSHGTDDLKLKMNARGGKLKAEDFLS